ncbi:hypothetical protein J3F84DRAFT_263392 [Trichoderma pleuroticola]
MIILIDLTYCFFSVGCWASLVLPLTVILLYQRGFCVLAEVAVCCKMLHSFVTPGTGVCMRGVGTKTKSTMDVRGHAYAARVSHWPSKDSIPFCGTITGAGPMLRFTPLEGTGILTADFLCYCSSLFLFLLFASCLARMVLSVLYKANDSSEGWEYNCWTCPQCKHAASA